LFERNPRLVVVRVSGFGQTGPYALHPGFATIAEALSGYASLCGDADGPPHLPPVALTDEVTALAAAFAATAAILHAERTGEGQVIDVNLLETMIQLLGPLPSAYLHLDYEQPRMGSKLPFSAPRGTYRCSDGVWVAISASAESVAGRVLRVLDAADDPRFRTAELRVRHLDELDALVAQFTEKRSSDEVLRIFREADAAIAPVSAISDVVRDPHVRERGIIAEVDGVLMQAPFARFSRTPAHVRFGARSLGEDNPTLAGDPWTPDDERTPDSSDPVASSP
jgi:crotonobetainyl-CoA:carnitine CoA-transferase CaiB-like acyl-CoA transferase